MTHQKKLSNKETEHLLSLRKLMIQEGEIPAVRAVAKHLGYKYPRSVSYLYEQLEKKGYLQMSEGKVQYLADIARDETHAETVPVPLVGRVACGVPLLAQENIDTYYPVSVGLAKPPHSYFLLKASGDSMNLSGIKDGDLVLVRRQNTARNGDRVVALVDNDSTIKEFHSSAEAVILKPRSRRKVHKEIILTRDFQVQGVVVATIPRV
ncbi:MAG: transcriptional repressor LexA [Elusimicrobia bacterium]|nr:transcriptional repressor LexA [Elusimicrobiota bacterium]